MRLQISGPYCWKAGSVHFCVGRGNLAGCCQASGSKSFSHCSGSSQQQRMRERGRDGGRESEIKGDTDLGGRQLTPLMVGLLCTLASHFRSKAHTEHSSIKHSSQQGRLDVLSVSVLPNGLWQWHTSAYRRNVSMQNMKRMSTFGNIMVTKTVPNLKDLSPRRKLESTILL